MPNYSLVVNSQFNPFTYQELLAPVQAMSNYHEKLMDEYDKLSSQADVLEAMGANDRDKGTYGRYKAYSDSLRKERDNLFANGLTFESRQRLSDLRRLYNTEIVPIQNAWQKREQEAQMQMKAQMDAAARGVNMYFSRDAANTSLQDYIDNPNQTFQILNGQQLTTEAANVFKALGNQVQSDGKGNYFLQGKQLSPIEYSIIKKTGMDWNKYQDFANNPDAPEFSNLRGILNNILEAHGVGNFSPDVQRRALQHAIVGASAGVGTTDVQLHTDPYQKMVLEDQMARRRAAEEYSMKAQLAAAQAAASQAGAAGSPESPFSISEYQLPLHGTDYSNAGENESAMRTLGYVKNKNGVLMGTGKVGVTYEDGTGRHVKDVSIFGKNGKILNRRDFVAQAGNSKEAKTALNKYFDRMVDAGKTLGIYGKMYTRKELTDHYNKLAEGMNAQGVNVYGLNYENSAWNTTSREYPVREIKGYKNGKPVFETKSIKLNDLLNKKDSNKNNLNISAFWSNAPGHQGIILNTTEDGKEKRYFIDASNMAENNITAAMDLFKKAEAAKAAGDLSTASIRIQDALGRLHTGLTTNYKPNDQAPVRQPSLKQQGLIGGE